MHLFICQICGRGQSRRVASHRVVVETRNRVYPYRAEAQIQRRPDLHGRMKTVVLDDPGGRGREIAREAVACAVCAGGGRSTP